MIVPGVVMLAFWILAIALWLFYDQIMPLDTPAGKANNTDDLIPLLEQILVNLKTNKSS